MTIYKIDTEDLDFENKGKFESLMMFCEEVEDIKKPIIYEEVEQILNDNLDNIINIVKNNLSSQKPEHEIMKCLARYFN